MVQQQCNARYTRDKTTRLFLAVIAALLFVMSAEPVRAEHYIYTVRPGDNPWRLAQRYLKSMRYWQPLQRLNGIEQPRTIPPGTKLKFPVEWLKVQPAFVKVIEVQGDVRVVAKGNTTPQALKTGDQLKIGDRIITGTASSSTLEYADGSRMLLQAETELVFDQLSAYGDTGMVDTRLRLPSGRVDTQVTPSKGPASRYEITTPSAVAAVRGTSFRVSSEGTKQLTRAEVLTGLVGVEAAKVEREVPAGFGTVAEAGKPPSPPKALLPAPDVQEIPTVFVHVPFQLSWPEVTDAVAYRIQLFPQDRPAALLQDQMVTTNTLSDIRVPDGDYILRLRAVDALGLEGLNAEHRFTVDDQPVAPALLDLINNKIVREPQPAFNWSQPQDSVAFHFQLARDAGFETMVVDLPRHDQAHFHPAEALPPGEYYWRVASVRGENKQGPFSTPQVFQITTIPPAPQLEVPVVEDDMLVFRWVAAADASQYQLQLANDREFDNVVIDETVSETELRIKPPRADTYYARIRAVDAHDYPGPFSEIQEVNVSGDEHVPLILLIGLLLLL